MRSTDAMKPTIDDVLSGDAFSYALKRWLKEALSRDVVDALHDAELLAALLRERCDSALSRQ